MPAAQSLQAEKKGMVIKMRRIKVAAIQPKYLRIPQEFDFLKDDYKNSPNEIMEHFLKVQMEVTFHLLEQAGREGCDIVTTCEDVTGTSNYAIDITENNIFPKLLELTVPIVEKRLSELSKKYSMYIIGCYNKRIENRNYNVASVFDRGGNICGEYRKTHLPPYEQWQITEGDDINTIELDFGKIGISICYDMMFSEFVQVQALKGAEIIFHPTAGYGWYDSIGEATLRTRANDNNVYIVTAKNYVYNGAGNSSIIDFWGQVQTDAGFYENVIVTKEIDLDFKKTQPDWFFPAQVCNISQVGERKLKERRPELYGTISEILHEKLKSPDREALEKLFRKIKSGECHW